MKPPASKRPVQTAQPAGTAAASSAAASTAPKGAAPTSAARSSTAAKPAAKEISETKKPPVAAPAPEPVAPRIGVQVEPTAAAGLLYDRHDFYVRGRVVSNVPVGEISLFAESACVGRILLGLTEASSPIAFPDGELGLQHNFAFNLPYLQAFGIGQGNFSIAVRTHEGQGVHASFVLRTDPENPQRGLVIAGPTEQGASMTGVLPSIILYAERATIDADGLLHVQGWAVSMNPLVTIEVFADDERVGAALLGGARDDVGSVHTAYPNARVSGFSLSAPLRAKLRRATIVRVQALALNGSANEALLPVERPAQSDGAAPASAPAGLSHVPGLAAEPKPPAIEAPPAPDPASDPRRAIALYCDELTLGTDGVVWISGWVVCATGIAGVDVLLDDDKVGEAELGLPRRDVGNEFPHIPSAQFSGFRLQVKALDGATGEHVLSVVARNGLDDVKEFKQTVTAAGGAARVLAPTGQTSSQAGGADPQAFKFQLDNPPVTAGAMTQPVTGRLTIEGWALAREGVEGIDIFLDDQRIGSAHYGLARQDVGSAFPDWVDSLRSGYAFHCPPRSLRDGEHSVSLHVKAKHGETLVETFKITVAKAADSDDNASIRRRMARTEAELYAGMLERLGWQPAFRLLLRHDAGADPAALGRTLASLQAQAYPHWRADLLGDGTALREAVAAAIETSRVAPDRIGFLDKAGMAQGFAAEPDGDPPVLVGVLSSGDELGCDALAEIAVQSGMHRDAELLYADEIRTSPASGEREVFFKPAFSPDLLLSTNYIGRPWFARPALLGRAGASPDGLLKLGEYDLLLRCAEHTGPAASDAIRAVPRLLCERAAGAATGASPHETLASEKRALAAAARRRGIKADVEPGCLPGIWRLRRRQAAKGKVSIIIPTCGAQGFIRTCVATLQAHTAYRNFEIIAIDNIPPSMAEEKAWLHQSVDKIVDIPEAFNWSRFNNRAAEQADGEFLLFLNDDIEVIRDDWLDVLLEHAQRPEVGVVGPQLLYPDGKVQHAGMFLAGLGLARHAFRFAAADEPGYFGLARTQRNVIAVTGACMLVRRSTFEALGRFDESHEVINNDLDFCLRSHDAGLLNVFTPHTTLIHHELASRANVKEVYNLEQFESRWRMRFAHGDPYHHPLLSKHFDDYRPNDEPVREVFSGHPLFRAEEIKRILVVKVDHIGDFITALAPIRRLKAHFPQARIAVLASATVRSFAALDPAIDEIIDFNFFHVRSALGKRELEDDELTALRARLAPYAFDLAIDMRKHLDTRELLRYAGARFTAGFDYMGQYPWLDVSLEWEGDRGLHPKRYHITDDLLHLVDTVAMAAHSDRTGIPPQSIAALRSSADIPEDVKDFLAGPVVCVHAGAGNEMKQWPVTYFATLIDMLITRNKVRVVLIGGPDETEIEQQLLAAVEHGDQVMSLVGKLKLHVLPAVMAGCTLYVGNDSGPKHIAAAVGIPTVGVHSGTVDPTEWAPMGPSSVAVARAMACSPCYLNRLVDCSRGLACLREMDPVAVHRICEMMLARQVPASRKAARQPPQVAMPPQAAPAKQTVKQKKKAARSREEAVAAPVFAAPEDHGTD